MSSLRDQIIAAVVADLQGDPLVLGQVPGYAAHRMRGVPLEKEDLDPPAGQEGVLGAGGVQVVYPAQEQVAEEGETHDFDTKKTLRLRVEHRAQVQTGNAHDATLDPLYVYAVQTLLAASGTALSALVFEVRESLTVWDFEELQSRLTASATEFEIDFYHQETDPEIQT